MVSKSCLLGLPVFMVFCLLGDALLNKTKDWALVNAECVYVEGWEFLVIKWYGKYHSLILQL